MRKYINGYVIQEWDEQEKKLVSQEFVAEDGNCVEYTDDMGEFVTEDEVPEELQKAYLPMNMVQPGEDYWGLDMPVILETARLVLSNIPQFRWIADELDLSDEELDKVKTALNRFME